MRATRRQLLAGIAAVSAAPVLVAAPELLAPAGAAPEAAKAVPSSTRTFGKSVQGRALRVTTLGDPAAPKKILVVGVIHGNEQAGLKVLALLRKSTPPTGTALLLVDAINPDGQHRNTRQNAHGVDLNRNFPTRWARNGKPFDVYYPGPRAVSEPETKALMALIAATRPAVTIYYHQHLDVIDLSGGSEAIERAYAHRVGMKPEQLTRYGGSACTWADTVYRSSTAFCVELPSVVSTAKATTHAKAVLSLANDQAKTIPAPAVAASASPMATATSPAGTPDSQGPLAP